MTDQEVEAAAREVASLIIGLARESHGPVVFVTGNRMVPPLRDFSAAERVYQDDGNDDGELFAYLNEQVENLLDEANVHFGCQEHDGSLYAVDLERWSWREDAEDAETLDEEWEARL